MLGFNIFKKEWGERDNRSRFGDSKDIFFFLVKFLRIILFY